MWRFDGTQWRTVDLSSIRGYLNAIGGIGRTDIWVVGGQAFLDSSGTRYFDSTLIVHYDGVRWNQIAGFPRKGELSCISVFSPTSVWAAGGGGILYRLNGSSWEVYEEGEQYFFSSIAALSATEAYAVGHVDDDVLPVDTSFGRGGYAAVMLLIGIVVSNAILMVDYVGSRLTAGSVPDALIHAAADRLRPILMTSFTTIAALVPLLVWGERSSVWYPLALGTIGGLLSSAGLSLLAVPVLLSFLYKTR